MKKTDVASMAVGLEVRCPLLDHVLIECSNAAPAAWHIAGGRGKALLREIARSYLPAETMNKPKTGFAIPLARWLRGPLQPLLTEHLMDSRFAARGLFNAAAVHRMVLQHGSGARDWSNRLWALLMLEMWFRRFIDGDVRVR
jgi:asparagine synthase (glutamine-hydrolysing)